MSLEFTLVRRAISLAVIDGPDTGDNPDILKAQGSVLFEPVIKKGDSIQVQTRGGSETYALAPIECPINDGIISHRGQDGVKLPAGGEAANPSLIRWKATFSRMQAGGKSFTLAPVIFDAVPGGEIDLTMVAPVAGAPEGVVRGPRGTSLESIIVDGSELVFTAVDDAGSFEIARIPLDEMVRAEAEAAADGVRDALAVDVAASQSARDAAEGHANRAVTAESNAATSETNAKQSETNAGDYAAVATTAATEAVDAMEAAATVENAALNAVSRVDALEAMAGLAPESPVDGQTANLIAQPDTLTRRAIDTAFTESIPPYLQRTGLDDAYMRGSEYPLSGALGVLKARLMAKDIDPIVLVFAGSSTTEGSNVPLANRWVTKIAEKATHEPVVSSYEAAVDAAPFHEGVTVVNMGRSGYNSGTYIRSEEAPVVGSWSPTLVMHAAGANDARTTWGTPAAVAGYISSRIDAIDTASPLPVAHILLHQHERYDGELLAPWRDYWEAISGIATTRPNVSVINAADVFKALGVPGSDPLGLMESDKVHVNTKGHAIYSDLIGDVLDLPEKVDRTTILFDDFNRPDNTDIEGDSPTSGPSGSVWESLTSPKIYIKNNRAAAEVGTAATALIDTGVADGDITVDFDFLTPGSSVAGVVFRATDIDNRWGVYIGRVNNKVELYRMVDGVNTIMSGATVGGGEYSKTGVATMRIRVKGQRINAWIDGVKMIEHTMTEAENAMSRTWTKVGFRATSSVAEFDNLKVASV